MALRRAPHPIAVLLAALLGACAREPGTPSGGAPPAGAGPRDGYVGSVSCAGCHPREHAAWVGSHHDLAMQVASEDSVLGDFDGASLTAGGVTTRFLRRGEGFAVRTVGPDGVEEEYEVPYVFGVEPLQQLLLPLPGGRLQSLTVAWDAQRGRWFDLQAETPVTPDDELHWSGRYLGWNAMCAECHSTDLRKGYDPASDAYATTWSELDVACEACHGPGEEHLRWAAKAPPGLSPSPAAAGLAVGLRRGEQTAIVETCAPCHSRRARIAEPVPGERFLDAYLPERLHAGLYHADGQVLDEVYEYGSFLQSRMHQRGVTCTDCHDPHSLDPIAPGDAVCMQCHSPYAPRERFPTLKAKDYATPAHHFHPQDSDGARCVSCHMPERTYMVVDPRRDHSFRVPRPDLGVQLGTPNACNGCHADQDAAWADGHVRAWREASGGSAPRPSFAPAFAAARAGDPAALDPLAALVRDAEQPGIVRATALELWGPREPADLELVRAALADPEPLVRYAALGALEVLQPAERVGPAAPLLADELRAVRIEAARVLAAVPEQALPAEWRGPLAAALAEYEAAQLVSADLPAAHLSLGALHEDRREPERAAEAYRHALRLDARFAPARTNLARLESLRGRAAEAVRVLEEGVALEPGHGELRYALGLALAEAGEGARAADELARAAELLPGRARVHYNAGLALQAAGRLAAAERELARAVQLDPRDAEATHALALLYLERGALDAARHQATRLAELLPGAQWVDELRQRIDASRRSAPRPKGRGRRASGRRTAAGGLAPPPFSGGATRAPVG